MHSPLRVARWELITERQPVTLCLCPRRAQPNCAQCHILIRSHFSHYQISRPKGNPAYEVEDLSANSHPSWTLKGHLNNRFFASYNMQSDIFCWDGWMKQRGFVPQISWWGTWASWRVEFAGHSFHCFSSHMDLWENTLFATPTIRQRKEEK